HSSTRKEFARLERESRSDGRRSVGERTEWLNSRLLPLYRRFRTSNQPFSRREREYLRLRSGGTRIAEAARSILGIRYTPATIIERAFLGLIRAVVISFPDELPLPPFTEAQRALMKQPRYVKL